MVVQRTAALNALRGRLSEIGVVAAQGVQNAYALKEMAAGGFDEMAGGDSLAATTPRRDRRQDDVGVSIRVRRRRQIRRPGFSDFHWAFVQAGKAALFLEARQPAKPRPAKPIAIITQAEGSGMAEGIAVVAQVEGSSTADTGL